MVVVVTGILLAREILWLIAPAKIRHDDWKPRLVVRIYVQAQQGASGK
jgi:hypothetical protein